MQDNIRLDSDKSFLEQNENQYKGVGSSLLKEGQHVVHPLLVCVCPGFFRMEGECDRGIS